MASNPNSDIIEHLIKKGEFERDINQKVYKFIAFRKAAKALGTLDTRVKSGKEAKKLPGIGEKIAEVIEEYLQGGGQSSTTEAAAAATASTTPSKKSSKNDSDKTSTSEVVDWSVLEHHDKLYLSKVEALRLQINQVHTIAELRAKTDLLSKPQIACLKHIEDLCKPISREEIEKTAKLLKKNIEKHVSPQLELTVCGAYRRGASESDHIDVLLVHSKIKSTASDAQNLLKDTLSEVIEVLRKEDILKKRLKVEQDRFEGLIQRKPSALYRRLNLRLVPKDHSTCALFYLTGNETFCLQIQEHALSQGYILDENCLRRIGLTCVPGQPICLESEEELFEYIDHQFVKPEKRNV